MFKKINLFDSIVIGLIITFFILFVLYPFVAVFSYGYKGELFSELLTNLPSYSHLLVNTVKVASATTIVTVFISVAVSLYYFIGTSKFKKIIVLIFMISMISPPFVTSLSYINLFGRRGLISYDLLKLNYDPYGFFGIVSMQSVTHISINVLLLVGFLKGIDKGVINSARSLGANTNRIILDILLPLMRPVIKVVILLTFLRSMADFATPAIIGGKYNVLATEGYLSFIAEGNISKAVVMNLIILIPSLLIFLIFFKSFRNTTLGSKNVGVLEADIKKSGIIYYISLIVTVIIVLMLASLYSAIVISAFSTMEYGKLIFTLQNFIDATDYITDVFVRSVIYSLIAGLISSVVGHVLQYYIYIRNVKVLKMIDFVATLPYILPGTFFGLGYVLAFNSYPLKLTGTALIVILNLVFKQMPFATKIGYSSISQVSEDQLKSVRDLGGGRFNEIKDVVFPMSYEGFYISFINGFTATMTTIGSIIFLIYPSQKVATIVMFDVIESGKYDIGSVIAFYIIMICLVINISYYLIVNRRR